MAGAAAKGKAASKLETFIADLSWAWQTPTPQKACRIPTNRILGSRGDTIAGLANSPCPLWDRTCQIEVNLCRGSSRALSAEDELDRVDQNLQIERQRQVLDVVEVVAELARDLFRRHRVPGAHLRPAGEAGSDLVAQVVEGNDRRERGDVDGHLGARAHQAHVAAQDVEALRQLVEAIAAEHGPQPRHAAGVVAAPPRVGAARHVAQLPHRAELVEAELAAAQAHALLDEQD